MSPRDTTVDTLEIQGAMAWTETSKYANASSLGPLKIGTTRDSGFIGLEGTPTWQCIFEAKASSVLR